MLMVTIVWDFPLGLSQISSSSRNCIYTVYRVTYLGTVPNLQYGPVVHIYALQYENKWNKNKGYT